MRLYATEAEFCAAFLRGIGPRWTVYPEANGYDIFLVRDDGYQVGVEAKLRPSLKLVQQVASHVYWSEMTNRARPDCIVAACPDHGPLREVMGLLRPRGVLLLGEFSPGWRRRSLERGDEQDWPAMPEGGKRCEVPAVIGDDVAGQPCGPSCTPWKLGAIRLAMLMRQRGYLTAADFKAAGVGITTWRAKYWIAAGEREGRVVRYVPGPAWVWWDEVHPTVAEQLRGGAA